MKEDRLFIGGIVLWQHTYNELKLICKLIPFQKGSVNSYLYYPFHFYIKYTFVDLKSYFSYYVYYTMKILICI